MACPVLNALGNAEGHCVACWSLKSGSAEDMRIEILGCSWSHGQLNNQVERVEEGLLGHFLGILGQLD